ncbi:MAG: hypothetical protein O9326_05875, partial [Microcystis sp. LE19-338.1B]|nr:hypothetical protein [Microcystis sp. LE19-338.1B]MCZ8359936.1 hypothetical protein [Microcystis sp. LE19-388.1G]
KNKFVKHKDKTIMLQATSIYTQGNGEKWDVKKMFDIMLEISKTSLKVRSQSCSAFPNVAPTAPPIDFGERTMYID